MEQSMKLDFLSNTLLEEIKKYGILEISMEQYRVVCNKLLHFASEKGVDIYTDEIIAEYSKSAEQRCNDGSICREYLRFQKRVLRMISSLVKTGKVDFSSAHNSKKYNVSEELYCFITDILDEYGLEGETRSEMDIVLRHFFYYADNKNVSIKNISDELLMKFLTEEVPAANKGSIGRTLRGIKYISDYLKAHSLANLVLNFNQLKIKTGSVKMIPPYSQTEIKSILDAVDCDTPEGMRDYAILILGFDTGLRGSDIRTLCLADIDWKAGRIKVNQCKTSEPLNLPLSGYVMNAIADYILKARPECGYREIFLSVKHPVRPMDKRHYPFTGIITKYCIISNVELKPMRGFHSLRRSFATELSMAGVPMETISQLLGHKRIDEDKPYLSYNREQIAFCSMGFEEIPLLHGIYANQTEGGADNDLS